MRLLAIRGPYQVRQSGEQGVVGDVKEFFAGRPATGTPTVEEIAPEEKHSWFSRQPC